MRTARNAEKKMQLSKKKETRIVPTVSVFDTEPDLKYKYKLASWLGLKVAELDGVHNCLLKTQYAKKDSRGRIKNISADRYLSMAPDPYNPPLALIKPEKWNKLITENPGCSNKELLERLLLLPLSAQIGMYYLFDPEYYCKKYEYEVGSGSPLVHFMREGMIKGYDPNPFLLCGSFLKLWFKENLTRRQPISPLQLQNLFQFSGASVVGIWPVYGSRHDFTNLNKMKILDEYIDGPDYLAWRHLIKPTEKFDVDFYRVSNPDLHLMDDAELAAHYEEYGHEEGRIASLQQLLKDSNVALNALKSDFDWQAYRFSSSDLHDLDTEIACISHFIQHGHREARLLATFAPVYDLEKYRHFLPYQKEAHERVPCSLSEGRVKLYFHIYYEDLVKNYLQVIEAAYLSGAEIYVNIACGPLGADTLALLQAFEPKYIISPNRGRDLGGYYYLSRIEGIGDDDIVALLHTKKSPHVSEQRRTDWVQHLIHAIGNTKDRFAQNVNLMCDDPTVMMIGAVSHLFIDNGGSNKEKLAALLLRLGLPDRLMLFPFVAGTMGIYRGIVLNRLFSVVHEDDLDQPRPNDIVYNVDGQFAHAMERALGAIAHQLGKAVWR